MNDDMKELIAQVKRMADSFEVITKSLIEQKNSIPYQNKAAMPPVKMNPIEELDAPSLSLEEEFFKEMARVYLLEGMRVKENDLQRKSSVLVANELFRNQIKFLLKHLNNYQIENYKSGLLLIRKEGAPVALLRFYTDLGYGYRGERWITGKKGIKDILIEANKLGIPHTNIYFLIMSWFNGIDNSHIRKMLNTNISNKDIVKPENRASLEEYIEKYLGMLGNYLPDPYEQIHLLCGGDLHTNVYAQDIVNGEPVLNIKNYQWLAPSVTELIEKLNNL